MPMISSKLNYFCNEHFIFSENRLLVKNTNLIELPSEDILQSCLEFQFARDWFSEASHGYTAMMLETDSPTPAGCKWIKLRSLFAVKQGTELASHAARAMALLNWRSSTRFCGRCGGPMQDDKYETARKCMLCGNIVFPIIAPAMIVLIQKDDTILLARHAQHNSDIYTCLAGYIEHGESAEEAVSREVREETGIEIQNIRYITSQSWPFPDQLMFAFKADWKSGEITPDNTEIDEAMWFSRNKLPAIPKPGSVAYRLIMGEI